MLPSFRSHWSSLTKGKEINIKNCGTELTSDASLVRSLRIPMTYKRRSCD